MRGDFDAHGAEHEGPETTEPTVTEDDQSGIGGDIHQHPGRGTGDDVSTDLQPGLGLLREGGRVRDNPFRAVGESAVGRATRRRPKRDVEQRPDKGVHDAEGSVPLGGHPGRQPDRVVGPLRAVHADDNGCTSDVSHCPTSIVHSG